MRSHPLRTAAAWLGFYAGILGIQHGVFEILQGNAVPDGLLINAIGPPCQPDQVWHACFPALTVVPSLRLSGILAVLVSLTIIGISIQAWKGNPKPVFLFSLSLGLLLIGGGFVPVYWGLLSAAAGLVQKRMADQKYQNDWHWSSLLSRFWPGSLLLSAIWLPSSWILGTILNDLLLALSGVLFIVFDLGLPLLIMSSAAAQSRTILIKG